MFYRRYFCYFPYHRFRSWLIGAGYVYQLVPLRDGSADHYPWSSSDGSLSFSLPWRSKINRILEPTNRRMSCFQPFFLVLALVLVGRLALACIRIGSCISSINGKMPSWVLSISLSYTLGMAIPFCSWPWHLGLVLPYFQSSQTPSLVAEENRWSHHHHYGDFITLGTIE